MKKVLAVAAMGAMLSGCSGNDVSQDSSCMFFQIGDAKKQCKNGQVATFMPMQWGNDQLPILAASSFCDFRYPIVHNNGGVSCIFTDARLKEPQVKQEGESKKDEAVK